MRNLICTLSLSLAVALSSGLPTSLAGEVAAPAAEATAEQDTLQPGLAADAVRRYNKAANLLAQGQLQAANQVLISVTRDYPSYYRALVMQAKTYDLPREKKLMQEALEKAVKIQQDEKIKDVEALYTLAEFYHTEGNLEKAEEMYVRGTELKASNTQRQNALIFNALGNLYLEKGENEKGLENIRIAAEQYGSQNAKEHLKLRETKAGIDRQLSRADKAIKEETKTGYDITTTLPLPADDGTTPTETKKPEAKPETGSVGAASAGK